MTCCNKPHNHSELPTFMDLKQFYTKAEIAALIPSLEDYYTKDEIDTLLEDYYTKDEIDTLLDIPAFSAYLNSTQTNATGDGSIFDIPCNVEIYDIGSNFGGLGFSFTAPIAGVYTFSMGVYIFPIGSSHTFAWEAIYTSNRTFKRNERNPYAVQAVGGYNSSGFTIETDMDQGDIAKPQIFVNGGAKTVGVYGSSSPFTFFSGHLVRRF